MSTATLTLGIPVAGALFAARRRLGAWLRTPIGIGAVALVSILVVSQLSSFPGAGVAEYGGPVLYAPSSYRADLYNVVDCQVKPTGDRFIGLDNLMVLMGRGGLKFYDSATDSLASGPDGIIGTDDTIVIKINYQWTQRGGTNTDLLAGLIRRIVDHPDSFAGEIVVCENAQFVSIAGFDRDQNNAKDKTRSPHDVVVGFQNLGYNVSHYDWTAVRGTSVSEYSDADMTDGYILYDYNSEVNGRVSYPKFQTDAGTYISLKHGIWDPVGETYDREHLKFINVPVLKAHGAVYGATSAVKNYMGVVSDALGTNSHGATRTGILGAQLGEIQLADLNIIDAIYINAVPTAGPSCSYVIATKRKELIACIDPVAADIWAVTNILIPAFIDNGFSPPWPDPSADPADSTSDFRQYLDSSMYQILAAGATVTNDLGQIDAVVGNGRAGDFDEDADIDSADFYQFAACLTGAGGGPVDSACAAGDFDDDGDVDCDDWVSFQFVWTDSSDIPSLPGCEESGTQPPGEVAVRAVSLLRGVSPNPMASSTRISYFIGTAGKVSLKVFDMRGRLVRTLVDEARSAGEHSEVWDGRSAGGKAVASGVYFCQLAAPGSRDIRKLVIAQ
jgi:hypothetical protein